MISRWSSEATPPVVRPNEFFPDPEGVAQSKGCRPCDHVRPLPGSMSFVCFLQPVSEKSPSLVTTGCPHCSPLPGPRLHARKAEQYPATLFLNWASECMKRALAQFQHDFSVIVAERAMLSEVVESYIAGQPFSKIVVFGLHVKIANQIRPHVFSGQPQFHHANNWLIYVIGRGSPLVEIEARMEILLDSSIFDVGHCWHLPDLLVLCDHIVTGQWADVRGQRTGGQRSGRWQSAARPTCCAAKSPFQKLKPLKSLLRMHLLWTLLLRTKYRPAR